MTVDHEETTDQKTLTIAVAPDEGKHVVGDALTNMRCSLHRQSATLGWIHFLGVDLVSDSTVAVSPLGVLVSWVLINDELSSLPQRVKVSDERDVQWHVSVKSNRSWTLMIRAMPQLSLHALLWQGCCQ